MKKLRPYLLGALLLLVGGALAVVIDGWLRTTTWNDEVATQPAQPTEPTAPSSPTPSSPQPAAATNIRLFPKGDPGQERLLFWWDEMVPGARQVSFATGPESNIHPDDYAGPESCQKCHKKNFQQWSEHPHRWMNAIANEATVKGDFTGESHINYLGGVATFTRNDDGYAMQLTRQDVTLDYIVEQTLGSRFFQYYIGRLTSGPYADDHPYRHERHVLPFGFWIDEAEWVPVVHVGPELPDGQRYDPFAPPETPEPGIGFLPYATYCNMCHTTFPLGDNLFRKPNVLAKHAPGIMHVDMAGYVKEIHDELWPEGMTREAATPEQIGSIPAAMASYEAVDHAVTLGISCEACHFGCQTHVQNPKKLPSFAPRSEYLRCENGNSKIETGRTHANVNWTCSRCHTGERPRFAAGMSTWNSTEYTDAMRGSCYSELKCVHCHSPHQATGKKWPLTPLEDDAKCLQCHQQFEDEAQLTAHTHHAAESSGSRCMNCHMPRLNEGLQDVVRTHTIFSPTQKEMIESAHPNACNLCHTEQSIDWTVKYLGEWYGANYDDAKLTAAYSSRQRAVGKEWLGSENEAVRLVVIDAMRVNSDTFAAAELIDALDDPYLLNRQFARRAVEELFGIELIDFGYRFYMTPDERAAPLEKLRSALADGSLRSADGK